MHLMKQRLMETKYVHIEKKMIFIRKELEEAVVNLLSELDGDSVKLNYISKILGIKSEDLAKYEQLKDVLNYLSEENIISKHTRQRYSLKKTNETFEFIGKLYFLHNKGYIQTENSHMRNIHIRKMHLNTALPGDIVKVILHAVPKKPKKVKYRGEVIEIVQRDNKKISGTVEFDGTFYFLIPDEGDYYIDFLIPNDKLNGAKVGDKVTANLIKWTDSTKSPYVEINSIIGQSGNVIAEYDTIVKEFDLDRPFSTEITTEIMGLKPPTGRAIKNRVDLKEKLIITIDPIDARDFDDALSLENLKNGNLLLGVHIADVSYYVKENTQLDAEAQRRGNSTYLVDRVIPMLPEKLSNEICSLNPGVPRYAFSVDMEINKNGDLVNYSIYESIIKSKRRYNYEEVLDIIQKGEGDNLELILDLNELAKLLKSKRIENGGFEFHTNEYKFELDDKGTPARAILRTTTESTSLVEECMLMCNKTVAEHIDKISKKYNLGNNLPFLYRIHDYPDDSRIKDAFKFIAILDKTISRNIIKNKDINAVLKRFENSPEKSVVHKILIRSMAKAVYSEKNIGHFGLGFESYSHFTSPIRRYPDLAIHRILKLYANEDKLNLKELNSTNKYLQFISQHCSDTERISMEAERASIKLALTILASDHINEIHKGKVSGVTKHGLFVILDDLLCEGLLHLKNLWDDFYYFDEEKQILIGKRTGKKYIFGSEIYVRIIKANIKRREIDYEFVKTDKKDY